MPISCKNLTKQYRRGREAVSGLTLDIAPGSVFALMGRNGAGKTTTIHLLLDLLRPTAGEARLFGVPSPRLRPQHRQRLGYVSENQHLPGWMRLGEFLRFLKPMYPSWDDTLTERLVKLFAVPLDQKLNQLSRGQRMKAAFLGALCYQPDILILDEPFSGLDSVIRQDLLDALITFLSEGQRTVLLSSHDLEEVERLTDTIGVLENGKLALHGKVDDLLATAREVTFTTAAQKPAGPLPKAWWHVVTGPLGATFTATDVTDDSSLATAVKQRWPDAAGLTIHPAGLRRLYIDFLRQSGGENPVIAAAA
jgi:ABC-2 type transport system ATP-binding protein